MTDDRAQKRGRQRGRISRAQAAFYSGLVGGAVSVAAGRRLRQMFGRRGASGEFAGTPCSRLPAEGGGDPIGAAADRVAGAEPGAVTGPAASGVNAAADAATTEPAGSAMDAEAVDRPAAPTADPGGDA